MTTTFVIRTPSYFDTLKLYIQNLTFGMQTHPKANKQAHPKANKQAYPKDNFTLYYKSYIAVSAIGNSIHYLEFEYLRFKHLKIQFLIGRQCATFSVKL